MTTPPEEALSFEKAFSRLEEILEKMNSGKTPLEEALQLFEEAERLMKKCNRSLLEAEQKIEVLIKDREGGLSLNEQKEPQKEPFFPG